jgi:lipoprotein NlpI
MVTRTRIAVALAVAFALIKCATAAEDSLDEARAALRRDDLAGAVRVLDRLIERDAGNLDARHLRGAVRAALKQHRESIADFDQVLRLRPQLANVYNQRGFERFKLGLFKEAIEDFDRYLELRPGDRPQHWQRGIALYYAGKFKEGVEQFELHQTVNPNDVENAVWHYLCNAKVVGPEKARAQLLTIGHDRRVPMMTVYKLFAGQAKPEDVLRDAEAGDPPADRKREHLFYAHLYLGLYYESAGDAKRTLEHMTQAAVDFASPHYMGDVARIHAQVRKSKP